jgi:hypothetical protein
MKTFCIDETPKDTPLLQTASFEVSSVEIDQRVSEEGYDMK